MLSAIVHSDDAMAIFLALRSPEIKVIGLTTIYGNVYTTLATRNALHLLEFAGRTDIPVAEGSHVSYMVQDVQFAQLNASRIFVHHDSRLSFAIYIAHGVDGLEGEKDFRALSPKWNKTSHSFVFWGYMNLVTGTCSLVSFLGEKTYGVSDYLHFLLSFCFCAKKATKLRVADFVHGVDGLGNQNFPQPKSKPIEKSAAEYLVEQANLYPGEITVVALGPLTNIALAIQLDPAFTKNIGQIVLLGGAFAVNGNVNPAAEANIFGDPEAADIVFTSGADVLAVGINVTHQVIMKDDERDKLAESDGTFAKYLCKILEYYFSYHRDAYSMKGVYLHDPTALLAAVNPSLMTYTEGVVRVQTSGITRGLTLFFNKQKRFNEETEWCNKPTVKVAVTVDAPAVVKLVMDRLMNS
ncbi:hypothetical protein OSB04_030928 [Centaurea solstitialis]|uniref:Inosine/uridine-preferring nucleoside hydrolase domain-containing protein n=1 Tax=Centaurea solstitialis TaxID=347529 RepID=A0AA38SL78_9ASTR|nr:hypothetical protein OSB04_030928 [Centaurea solstitialis]